MRLTKTAVEALLPGNVDRFFWDEDLPGFGVKVTPPGRRSYVVQYRPRGSQQARRVTLGRHGVLTTAKAREDAEQLLARVRLGEDPVAAERATRSAQERAKAEAQARRFETVLHEFIERYAKPKNRQWKDARRVIAHDALPAWEGRPIEDITRRDLMQLIDKVAERSPSSARALYAQLRRMFGWALERDYLQHSPFAGTRAPAGAPSRDRWLDDDEVRLLWRALEQVGGPFEPLFKLLLLTGQRREEVTGMRWREVDLDRAEWIIPRERSKNDAAHAVDLPPSAAAILQALPRRSDLVFTTTGDTPLSGHAKARKRVHAAMRVLMASDREATRHVGLEDIPPWRLHDLRRTAATGMAALGHPPHVVEAVLNHRSGTRGGLVAVYQHYQHRPERKAALLDWAAHLERITQPL